jgi:hypothetical protein
MRRVKSLLVVVALAMGVVALPILARAEEPVPAGECRGPKWDLTEVTAVEDLAGPKKAAKAEAKDAKGNEDGFVCLKENKKGKVKVRDNRKPLATEPTEEPTEEPTAESTAESTAEGSACPGPKWELTAVEGLEGRVGAKAEAKDAKGNEDGQVCLKVNRKGKTQVKDNNNPDKTETGGTEPEGTEPEGTEPEGTEPPGTDPPMD